MKKIKQYISNTPLSQEVIEKDNHLFKVGSCFQLITFSNILEFILIDYCKRNAISTESVSYIRENVKDVLAVMTGQEVL